MSSSREHFSSRIGFILMTAGCAIGLGNVWRFPFIAGQYGGGLFVCLYLFFLLILGFPVMCMELAVGRAGQNVYPLDFKTLQNPETKFQWSIPGFILFSGNLILLMFYTVVTGWMLAYTWFYCSGGANKIYESQPDKFFGDFLGAPGLQIVFMLIGLVITLVVCFGGIQKSIEKVIKFMMAGLFLILLGLVVRSAVLPKAVDGFSFFLYPSTENFVNKGLMETIHAAMAQAFFTLSLGIGSIAICGSYIQRERSLANEATWIIILDTLVAIASGLIIFPCCSSFDITPNAGPALIFITLPKIFQGLPGGAFWGSLFFLFMSIAALSTLIAVFENLVAFGMDVFHWKRIKSCTIFGIILGIASFPCIFGFNIWSSFQPLGEGTGVLDLEDFIVSDNLLPLGALTLVLFCTMKKGWGSENFLNEINTGAGWKVRPFMIHYCRWGLPVIVFLIWGIGIAKRFFPNLF